MNLEQLRAALREKYGVVTSLKEKAFAAGAPEADVKAFEDALDECEALERQIKAAEREQSVKAAASVPAGAVAGTGTAAGDGADARPKVTLTAKQKVALIVKATAQAARFTKSGHPMSAMKVLDDAGHGDLAKDIGRATQKALTEGVLADGGSLIPTALASEFIPFLYARSVIMSSNPRMIRMPFGNLTIPGGAAGATAQYVGETQPIGVAQPTFRTVTLNLKKLAGIVPVSNELITDSPFDIDTTVTDDLTVAINEVGDLQMLRGVGSAVAPTGILNLIPSGNKVAMTATPTITTIIADLNAAMTFMMNALIPAINPVWIMSPRTLGYLRSLLTPQAVFVFPTLQGDTPTLMGRPVKFTQHIPDNLGTGTNESEVYMIDFGHVLVGTPINPELVVTTSDTATVVVGGTPISAFQNDITYVRGIIRHDIDMRYLAAAYVITGVKWF